LVIPIETMKLASIIKVVAFRVVDSIIEWVVTAVVIWEIGIRGMAIEVSDFIYHLGNSLLSLRFPSLTNSGVCLVHLLTY
jgi:hypothetical protein